MFSFFVTRFPQLQCTSLSACARSVAAVPALKCTILSAVLFNFAHSSTAREYYHYTSYALAGGIPAALLMGAPISTLVDFSLGLIIPAHFHMGMRSVLIDYVHDPALQKVALGVLAGVTVLTAVGLTKFNIQDIGLTEGVKQLWVEQDAPARAGGSAAKAAAAAKHH